MNKKVGLIICLIFLNVFFVSAGTLKVTTEHPFLINGTWIPASQLKVGDELTLANGSKVTITKLTDVVENESFPVYNLEAGEYHNFVVGEEGVVVHNSNRPFLYADSKSEYSVREAGRIYQQYSSEGINRDNIGFVVEGFSPNRQVSSRFLTPSEILEWEKEATLRIYDRALRPVHLSGKYLLQDEIILFGRAKRVHTDLITYSRSLRDLPLEKRIDGVYAKLQQTIGVDTGCMNTLGMDRVLSRGGGVCRHKASLLNTMLREANVNSKEVFSLSARHVWVRIKDPSLGVFDMDPTWYIGPARLPSRGFSQPSNPFFGSSWESEFLRLNNL